jgi:rhodanese-related sulfurtransferase
MIGKTFAGPRSCWGIRARFAVPVLAFFLPLAGCGRSPVVESKLERIEALFEQYRRSFPDIENLSVEEVLARQKEGNLILVDVRKPEERRVSMIPGAISVGEFERDQAKYTDYTVVAYCTIGYRSGIYVQELSRRNLRSANIKGGILAWVHAGQKVINEDGETRKVHTYGSRWNLVPEGYEAVW